MTIYLSSHNLHLKNFKFKLKIILKFLHILKCQYFNLSQSNVGKFFFRILQSLLTHSKNLNFYQKLFHLNNLKVCLVKFFRIVNL